MSYREGSHSDLWSKARDRRQSHDGRVRELEAAVAMTKAVSKLAYGIGGHSRAPHETYTAQREVVAVAREQGSKLRMALAKAVQSAASARAEELRLEATRP